MAEAAWLLDPPPLYGSSSGAGRSAAITPAVTPPLRVFASSRENPGCCYFPFAFAFAFDLFFGDGKPIMSLPRKKLPIGIQSFAKLRNEGCYYVDKTKYGLQLIESGGYYFLSRPRRFGKSLFLDTLKELFEGNQSLFTGLYAENHWDWSVRYPVIRISFGTGVLANREDLDTRINELLSENAQRLGLKLHYKSIGGRLMHLIRTARETFGQPVVVLIDEYDKPILDNIENTERATTMREGLKDLYSVLKDADPHLKFVFLTGVSKFSKVSLFSGLNNLRDITVLPEYSALCGYTDADVDQVFAPELAVGDLNRQHIREWYNGYNWNGEAVYNPFDLLLLFAERKFRPYWYESGTPTFLIKLLSQRKIFLPELSHLQTDAALLGTFDVDNIPTEAIMFQAGYLTIDEETNHFGKYLYRLRYPNREVQQSLNDSLLRDWTPKPQDSLHLQSKIGDLLLANDIEGMGEHLKAFYASLPNEWFTNNPIAQYEGYYASVFYAFFASLGLDITVESSSNAGRLDMVMRFQEKVYIFEFKLVGDQADGSALRQIKEKDYAAPYRGKGEPIYLIGIEFSKTQRALLSWDVETEGLKKGMKDEG